MAEELTTKASDGWVNYALSKDDMVKAIKDGLKAVYARNNEG